MSVIFYDQSTLTLHIRCRPNESFTPDEQLKEIESKAQEVKEEYNKLTKRVQEVLQLCVKWNEEHDEKFAKKLKEQKQQDK